MKTVEEIFTYQRLYQSFCECEKDQMWKDSVIQFHTEYAERLLRLEEELSNGTYKAKPDNITYISERGKTRKINSQYIRDRVVYKIINQDILIPIFHKRFIYANTASQKNKGTDLALKIFKCHLNRAYRKWGKNFYILSIDMKKYFESIPHARIVELLKEEISDERLLYLCTESLRAYGGDSGLGLGSEMNQSFALLYLDAFDHMVKEKFGIKEYVRYADDMEIIHNDKEYLKDILLKSKEYFSSIGLQVNQKKTQIIHIKNGITFLGYRWNVTDTGHVLMRLKKESIARNKKKLRKMKRKLDAGEISYSRVRCSYASIRGSIARGNDKRLLSNMDNYYNKLFVEGWMNEYETERSE